MPRRRQPPDAPFHVDPVEQQSHRQRYPSNATPVATLPYLFQVPAYNSMHQLSKQAGQVTTYMTVGPTLMDQMWTIGYSRTQARAAPTCDNLFHQRHNRPSTCRCRNSQPCLSHVCSTNPAQMSAGAAHAATAHNSCCGHSTGAGLVHKRAGSLNNDTVLSKRFTATVRQPLYAASCTCNTRHKSAGGCVCPDRNSACRGSEHPDC
ncbi:hypothetical protein COO60DRAFT_552050 [Scenedesmus sp. NREL 46B-D3]|nr:hypothetical protein COO60DRAFT_552050 [Scenedesmus sp. NREL 46B-D3]